MISILLVGFIIYVCAERAEAADGGGVDPYQCYTHTIPCGWGSIFFEVWCVNAPANTNNIRCACGAEPFDPCGSPF